MLALLSNFIGEQVSTLPDDEQESKHSEARAPSHSCELSLVSLGIDFIGPYSPPSASGNKYVLTVSDYFTRFVWVKALPTKEASGVAQALQEVSNIHACVSFMRCDYLTVFSFISTAILMFGIPRVITTNQGKEFHNSLNREVMMR